MADVTYPASLPGPQTAPVQWAERRMLSQLPGPRRARAVERDQHGTQQVSFLFTATEAEVFRAWHDDELIYGGSWFAATWPAPNGAVRVRRFIGAAQWQFVPGGLWRVSAQCEVRGRGELPQAGDPFFDDTVLLLLMGGADGSTTFTDLSPAENPVTAFGAAQVDVLDGSNYLLLPGGLDYLSVPHAAALNLVDTDFTLEAIVRMTAYSTPAAGLLNKDGLASVSGSTYASYALDINADGSFMGGVGRGNSVVEFQWCEGSTPTGLDVDVHVALTRAGSTLRAFTAGALENEEAQTVSMVDGGKPLLIGWEQEKASDWYFNGRIKAVRITRACRYTEPFTPPTTFPAY